MEDRSKIKPKGSLRGKFCDYNLCIWIIVVRRQEREAVVRALYEKKGEHWIDGCRFVSNIDGGVNDSYEAEVPRPKAKRWEEEGAVDTKGKVSNTTLSAKMSVREESDSQWSCNAKEDADVGRRRGCRL
ncbi:hypothetical protein GW17_00018622 [Ensete ventricosum]|nr:hypothetical protein GW17_00018622 [Ensete ventricosum]